MTRQTPKYQGQQQQGRQQKHLRIILFSRKQNIRLYERRSDVS